MPILVVLHMCARSQALRRKIWKGFPPAKVCCFCGARFVVMGVALRPQDNGPLLVVPCAQITKMRPMFRFLVLAGPLVVLANPAKGLHLSDDDAQILLGPNKECTIEYKPGPPPRLESTCPIEWPPPSPQPSVPPAPLAPPPAVPPVPCAQLLNSDHLCNNNPPAGYVNWPGGKPALYEDSTPEECAKQCDVWFKANNYPTYNQFSFYHNRNYCECNESPCPNLNPNPGKDFYQINSASCT